MNTVLETANESDTTLLQKSSGANGKDSTVFGVSIRAWLAIMLVSAVVATHVSVTVGVVIDAVLTKDWSRVGTFANVGEPLYSMSIAALAFYFGQKTVKSQ
jgi:hypothetical protein